MNGLQATSSWKSYFNNPTGSVLGVVNAAQSIGSVACLPFVGILSDRLGRRWTLFSGAVLVVIASIIQAASINYAQFVISRLLVGVGGMLVTQPSPMLISELSYPTHRGKFTSLFWTCYYFGAILAAWATFGTQKHIGNNDWAWRAPSVLQAAYPIIQIIFFWWLPESPRWLIANGKIEQARTILAKYHTGGDANHELIEFEMTEIERAIEMEKQASATKWSSLVSTPGNRKRTIIAICVGAFARKYFGYPNLHLCGRRYALASTNDTQANLNRMERCCRCQLLPHARPRYSWRQRSGYSNLDQWYSPDIQLLGRSISSLPRRSSRPKNTLPLVWRRYARLVRHLDCLLSCLRHNWFSRCRADSRRFHLHLLLPLRHCLYTASLRLSDRDLPLLTPS